VNEALKHPWFRYASPDNHGTALDVSAVRLFLSRPVVVPVSNPLCSYFWSNSCHITTLSLRLNALIITLTLLAWASGDNGSFIDILLFLVQVEHEVNGETEIIQQKSSSAVEEAWLIDWFAKYKQDHDTYLIPIRELDLPIRLREYRTHLNEVSWKVV